MSQDASPPVWARYAHDAWIAFMVAIATTGLVFSVLDPVDLDLLWHGAVADARLATYTVGFFLLWAHGMACAWLCRRSSERRTESSI